MAGRYPKPESERRNRTKPTFEWSALPAQGRKGDPPALPEWRRWDPETVKWWAGLWAKPQAAMWDQTGQSLWPLAALYDDLFAGRAQAAQVSAEMRQHEDRHGLNPKAMLQLRWKIGAVEEPVKARKPATVTRLRAIDSA